MSLSVTLNNQEPNDKDSNLNKIMEKYRYIIFNDFTQFRFDHTDNDIDNNMHYIPVFCVGSIDETMAWASQARRIKFTKQAITHYKIPENVVVSNIQNPYTENYYYDDNKPYHDFLIGKTVGVVRRKVVNGQKIDIYHCPKYELLEIHFPQMFQMCTVKVRNTNDGIISDNINIDRISIPTLMIYD